MNTGQERIKRANPTIWQQKGQPTEGEQESTVAEGLKAEYFASVCQATKIVQLRLPNIIQRRLR